MRLTRGDVVAAFRPCFEELPTKSPELATWVWLADEDLSLPLAFNARETFPPFLVAPYETPSGWRVRVLFWGGSNLTPGMPWTVATFNCPDRTGAIGLAGWLGVTLNGAWGCSLPTLRVVR